PALAPNRAAVGSIRCHGAEAIKQRLARHAHMVKPDSSVVDAVQPGLVPAVLNPDPRTGTSPAVANGHQQGVNALTFTPRHQLGEDGRDPAIPRGIADVILA